jgi:hypothetical protein
MMWEMLGFPGASTMIGAVVAMERAIEKRSGTVRNGAGQQTPVRELI